MRMRLFVALVISFITTAESPAALWGPSTYEECMLAEMRGQPQSMYLTAHVVCARRFKKEQSASISSAIKSWFYERGRLVIEVSQSNDELIITRGKFNFSPKECAESKPEDFTQEKSFKFTSGEPTSVFLNPAPQCMKTLELWGLYK